MADTPGNDEQVSLDMFLEVENMELDCELAFSACCSATSSWEGRWNDVEGSENAVFQRGFSQHGSRAGGSGLLRAQRCWHAAAWVGHSWCSRVRASLYCSCAAISKCSWLKRLSRFGGKESRCTGIYVWCVVRGNYKIEEKREVSRRKKRKNCARQWGDQRSGHAGCYV